MVLNLPVLLTNIIISIGYHLFFKKELKEGKMFSKWMEETYLSNQPVHGISLLFKKKKMTELGDDSYQNVIWMDSNFHMLQFKMTFFFFRRHYKINLEKQSKVFRHLKMHTIKGKLKIKVGKCFTAHSDD